MISHPSHPQVVYLFGAGASHGSIKARASTYDLLMDDLTDPLAARIHSLMEEKADAYAPFEELVNAFATEQVDIEHIITFLDDSPSALHRQFADALRKTFYTVLMERLSLVREELADARFDLYTMLLDIYNLNVCPESLHAVLTINYDDFIESAASLVYNNPNAVDYGITVSGHYPPDRQLRIIKLHGSFYWQDSWPISICEDGAGQMPLWIPPGVRKPKGRYPFSVLWGTAREALDCDVLRIVGCRLSPNDWDLISLLFTTRIPSASGARPYTLEIIDSPACANEVKNRYPYLPVRSIFEIDHLRLGQRIVGDLTGTEPRAMHTLSQSDQKRLLTSKHNWFLVWLRQFGQAVMEDDSASLDTPSGAFREIWEEM